MAPVLDHVLYAEVQPVLFGYARRAVRQEALAADLVQDTWSAGARHLDSFDGRSSIRSWLVGIFKHKIVDHFRRAVRERPLSSAGEPAAEPDLDARIDARRALQVVGSALDQLPPLQRRAVELCDIRGLSREQAAAELGVERGHLRVLLHRARGGLRDALTRAGQPTLSSPLGQ
jgi:RNA polymerase sigma-70 factor (ECF subfamily)